MGMDCRHDLSNISKLWVSIPKHGLSITTMSHRITRIVCEHDAGNDNKTKGLLVFKIYDSQEAINTLFDPSHFEEKL